MIRQSPAGGVRAVEGSTITLVVSIGQEVAVVPDVVGLNQETARTQFVTPASR